MKVPNTKQQNVTETLHSVEITDSYRWLEDVKSTEVKDWLGLQYVTISIPLKNYRE